MASGQQRDPWGDQLVSYFQQLSRGERLGILIAVVLATAGVLGETTHLSFGDALAWISIAILGWASGLGEGFTQWISSAAGLPSTIGTLGFDLLGAMADFIASFGVPLEIAAAGGTLALGGYGYVRYRKT